MLIFAFIILKRRTRRDSNLPMPDTPPPGEFHVNEFKTMPVQVAEHELSNLVALSEIGPTTQRFEADSTSTIMEVAGSEEHYAQRIPFDINQNITELQ